MISLACVSVPPKAFFNVFDCLIKGRIGKGSYIQKFEEKFAESIGVKHAIAVANGTIADMIMLRALRYLNPDRDEVILPALTFIAQANSVVWAGLKPIFVDVGSDFQIDINQVRQLINERTLCVFPAHLLGNSSSAPADFFGDVFVLEDCCEAMGGKFMHHRLGTLGLAGSFSMFPSHTITTGEGGIIVTGNDRFAEICRSMRDHGKVGKDFDFEYFGINGKITNLQCAIGLELIDIIQEVNRIRRANVMFLNTYKPKSQTKRIDFFPTSPHCYPIVFENKETRDRALNIFGENDIECRKLMSCVPDTKPYVDMFGFYCEEFFHNAREFSQNGMYVPCHQNLKRKDLEKIGNVILQV